MKLQYSASANNYLSKGKRHVTPVASFFVQSCWHCRCTFGVLSYIRQAEPLLAADTDPWLGLKFGVATYTLRELPLEETIAAVKRVGLKYVSIKNVKNHIDLSHSQEERKARAQKMRDAGWCR